MRISHQLIRCGCFLVALLALHSNATADVYFDSPVIERLVGSKAATPGGIREVQLNGSRYLLVRQVEVDGNYEEGQNFIKQWNALQSLSGSQPKEVLASLMESVSQDGDFAGRDYSSTVLGLFERPMAFETDGFYGFGVLPYQSFVNTKDFESLRQAVIKSDAPLAYLRDFLQPKKGYLTLAEKPRNGGYPTDFWKIRFDSSEFNILSMLGDQSEDVKGGDPDGLARCPGSRRSFVMKENAEGWKSSVWSYEGGGRVGECITHYRQVAESAGFNVAGLSKQTSDYSFQQFSDGRQTLSVLVENLQLGSSPLQVTVQLQGS